jgi:hypothetical protein
MLLDALLMDTCALAMLSVASEYSEFNTMLPPGFRYP